MAKVAVACPHCEKRYALAEAGLGKSMKCPACQQAFVAAAEPPPEPEPEPEPDPAPATTSLLDDDEFFAAAANAPAAKRAQPPAGAGKPKKGKRRRDADEDGVRTFQEDGKWHADVPMSLVWTRPGTWLCWGAIAYCLLSACLGIQEIKFIDPWGLILAFGAGATGYMLLSGDYYKRWTNFSEMTGDRAPEPSWLKAYGYAPILLSIVAAVIWAGKTFGKPGTPLGPSFPKPAQRAELGDHEVVTPRLMRS